MNALGMTESEGVGPERVAELEALSFDALSRHCSQVLLLACGCATCREELWAEHHVIDLRAA